MPLAGCISIACKSVQDISSFQAIEILHCDLEKQVNGRSRSLIFALILGYCGTCMHHWDTIFCKSVNEIWRYHANKLCDGCTDGRTDHEHCYVPIKVVLFMIVTLLCFITSTRVVAILDFANMVATGVVRLGAHQKSKKYGLGNICTKFGAFGRIWTKNP